MRSLLVAILLVSDAIGNGGWGNSCLGQSPESKAPATVAVKNDPNRHLKDIERIAEREAASPPPTGGTLFVGSSMIRLWNLETNFPGKGYINHGFGGSHFSDIIYFADRIVFPLKPSRIVLYCGDNDLAAGKSVQQVHNDFETLVKMIRERLPATRLVVISVKPSPKRQQLFGKQVEVNRLIKQTVAQNSTHMTYIDAVTPVMLNADEARPELFVKDMLHMNEAGYEIWASLLKPVLDSEPATAVATNRPPTADAIPPAAVSPSAPVGTSSPVADRLTGLTLSGTPQEMGNRSSCCQPTVQNVCQSSNLCYPARVSKRCRCR